MALIPSHLDDYSPAKRRCGFRLFASNRLEWLSAALAEAISSPLSNPFEREIIVVQSQGMAAWLRMELAQHLGICANAHFPFPKTFAQEMVRAAFTDLPGESAYERGTMVWSIYQLLPALVEESGFEVVKAYLRRGAPGPQTEIESRRLYQLSWRVAHLFDQYLLFRPQMIVEWEAGQANHWQAELWRKMRELLESEPPSLVLERFFQRLEGGEVAGLPERVSVFGISALPPRYLDLLHALSMRIELNLFVLQPSQYYWGDIVSSREQERILKRQKRPASEAGLLHLEQGNRLLASMGKLGRDFHTLIWEIPHLQEASGWVEPGEATMLSAIQNDLFHLRENSSQRVVAAGDRSIQVHSCHTALREMEVLQDFLLDLFQSRPGLRPKDILVMAPEVEKYAPFIEAVFGSPEEEGKRIPFSVADRDSRRENLVVDAFLKLMGLAGSRLGVTAVMALLEAPPVRGRFAITVENLEMIRRWILGVGIRWGRDAGHRSKLNLPAFEENAWRPGLERLLLGYAMAGRGTRTFGDTLPYDEIEGEQAEVLGRWVEFMETLFRFLDEAGSARSIADWENFLLGGLDLFFAEGEEFEGERQFLRRKINQLQRSSGLARFEQEVPLEVVMEALAPELADDSLGHGFLGGGVTFCALKPMRSIPFPVICLLGMNDNAFPRPSIHLGFDLMGKAPKPGDRSTRDDDRYLFLETLLSAREILYISYTGQSVRDNREIPPSVLVSELLDYCREHFQLPGKDLIEDHVCTRHRFQGFSPAYFAGGRLFTYSLENFRACQALRHPQESRDFFPAPLSQPEEEWRKVPLKTLISFFGHPARFLALHRLGFPRLDRPEQIEERENFALDSLDGYGLRQELLARQIESKAIPSEHLFRQAGRLPPGAPGRSAFSRERRVAELFWATAQERLKKIKAEPVPIELRLGEFTLIGSLHNCTDEGLVQFRCASLKPKDWLAFWISHLALCAQSGQEAHASFLLGTDKEAQAGYCSGAAEFLQSLLEIYWIGLRQPLHFFPQSSHAFAERHWKNENGSGRKSSKTPLQAAQEKWAGGVYVEGESADPFFRLFFGGSDPLDSEFEKLALQVFEPMLDHLEKENQ